MNVLNPNIVICPSRFLIHKSPQGVPATVSVARRGSRARGGPVSSAKDISAALEESAGGS